MISSMTGYGRGEVHKGGITAVAEVRSVNSRFLELMVRLPRTMALRENDVREVVRGRITRGKINVVVSIEREDSNGMPLRINASAARAYYKLLDTLRKEVKIEGKVTLEQLLKFSEVLEVDEFDKGDEKEWALVEKALQKSLKELAAMRTNEGGELKKDLVRRIRGLDALIDEIEESAGTRLPQEKNRMQERIRGLVSDFSVVDEKRLELELAILADKLDVTEECVRFRSHNKFFLEAFDDDEAVGRKLNFLVQEMNREANTIGSKSSDAEIAHKVVAIKEELEKIREQLQNIE